MRTSGRPIREIEPAGDVLAAALSRKRFLVELESALARPAKDGSGVVVCLLDVDKLRNVNDRHGQAAGDAVLCAVASRLADALKRRGSAGPVARFDGDGLIVMLPGARLADGEDLAAELRSHVAGAKVARGLSVTVSIAVAAHRSGESKDALLARLEKTLHLAKQFGGDRIEIARTPEPRERRAPATSIDFLRA